MAMDIPIAMRATFRGRVLPEIWKATIGHPRVVRADFPGFNAVAELSVHIEGSSVTVDCSVSNTLPLGDLLRRAMDITQTAVDIIAFAKGRPMTVMFDTVIHDGMESGVATYSPGLSQLCTAYTVEHNFDAVFQLALKEPPLFVALHDLNTALDDRHLSPVNFARVLDSIRVMIGGAGGSWKMMHEALRVDEAYLKLVTDASKPKRHGNHERVEAEMVMRISERAWRVMDRFIAYRLGGNAALRADKFPTLTG